MEDFDEEKGRRFSDTAPQKRNGRLYIPHGHGKEKVFKPHVAHIDATYSDSGPDWNSRLRWISSPKPKPGQPADHTFFPPMKSIRHFPSSSNTLSKKEYNYYPPHGVGLVYGKGKQTIFNNVHRASQISSIEISDSLRFGSHGNLSHPRNEICEASPGDKPYQAVEYSWNFHKLGSTRPVVNFGHMKMQSVLPPIENIKGISNVKPYTVKEAERQRAHEIRVVQFLNRWRPATPLMVPIPDPKA